MLKMMLFDEDVAAIQSSRDALVHATDRFIAETNPGEHVETAIRRRVRDLDAFLARVAKRREEAKARMMALKPDPSGFGSGSTVFEDKLARTRFLVAFRGEGKHAVIAGGWLNVLDQVKRNTYYMDGGELKGADLESWEAIRGELEDEDTWDRDDQGPYWTTIELGEDARVEIIRVGHIVP